MINLSATQMIIQLEAKKTLAEFEKQNSLLYKQPKYVTERRLSPWLGKRKQNKVNKTERKLNQAEKSYRSEQTERFLRKIFPTRRPKQQNSTIDILSPSIYLQATQNIGKQINQRNKDESLIYLPIKPISFDRLGHKKQNKINLAEKQTQQMAQKRKIHKVQPCIQIKEIRSSSANQNMKVCPISITYRKSWKKREKCMTQHSDSINIQNMSISQIYRLIGKEKQKKNNESYYHQAQKFDQKQQKIEKSSWLISRSLKNNKKFKTKQILICKTHFI